MWKSLIMPFLATVLPVGSKQGADEINVSKGGTLVGPGLTARPWQQPMTGFGFNIRS
jgi:hypothetical protein